MIEIRKVKISDAKDILEYFKIIGGKTDNLSFGPEGIPITIEAEEEYIKNILNSKNQLFLVAVDGKEIVGTATFSGLNGMRVAHRGEISVAVKKSMWGKHIASRFIDELIRFAKYDLKAEVISLEVRSDNDRAIALYKKFGFEKIGTFEAFMKINGKDVSFDIMRLDL